MSYNEGNGSWFGGFYGLFSIFTIVGSKIKSEFEDITSMQEAKAKGDYMYLDSKGTPRRVDNNVRIRERVYADNGDLVDIDSNTGEILHNYTQTKKENVRELYIKLEPDIIKQNEVNKLEAIRNNRYTYVKTESIYQNDGSIKHITHPVRVKDNIPCYTKTLHKTFYEDIILKCGRKYGNVCLTVDFELDQCTDNGYYIGRRNIKYNYSQTLPYTHGKKNFINHDISVKLVNQFIDYYNKEIIDYNNEIYKIKKDDFYNKYALKIKFNHKV